MITRIGVGVCPRLSLSPHSLGGMPRRTLSRLSVVWPTRTASASARCRNKCSLSSREVKSTGPKFRVVILPSTVMANVALTNGRAEMWERPWRRDRARPARTRDTEVPPTFLLRLLDFMLHRGHFALHFAQTNTFRDPARFVEKVNDAAGSAADHNDKKPERSNELGFFNGHTAKIVEHDLKEFFAEADSSETYRNRSDGALNRHDGEKIDGRHWHRRLLSDVFGVKGISDEQKRGEGCQMSDKRCAEGKQAREPMTGVKMISRGDLNQFLAPGKFVRQEMKKIKAADDEADEQPRNRNAEKNAKYTKQLMRRKTGFDRDWSSP